MRDNLGSSLPLWQTSTTEGVPATVWRKSSFSQASTNSDCVEVALTEHGVALRDSKNADGPVLCVSAEAWRLWRQGLRATAP
jgi:hypothetical protein